MRTQTKKARVDGNCELGLTVEEDNLVEKEMNRGTPSSIQVSLWKTDSCEGLRQ